MPATTSTIILDNGASTIKAGVLGVHNEQPQFVKLSYENEQIILIVLQGYHERRRARKG